MASDVVKMSAADVDGLLDAMYAAASSEDCLAAATALAKSVRATKLAAFVDTPYLFFLLLFSYLAPLLNDKEEKELSVGTVIDCWSSWQQRSRTKSPA